MLLCHGEKNSVPSKLTPKGSNMLAQGQLAKRRHPGKAIQQILYPEGIKYLAGTTVRVATSLFDEMPALRLGT